VADHITSAVVAGPHGRERGARRPSFFLMFIFLGVVAASLLILKFAPAPFFWGGLAWAAALWVAIIGVHGSWPRAILLNLGIVAIMLAGAEVYITANEYTSPTLSDDFYVPNDVLGWAPAKGIGHGFKAGPAGLFHGPKGVLFDVDYTIDPNGLRTAPPWGKDDLAGTVLFFGCSFTFGEGLKNNETLPYQVGALSGGRYRTFNFGVGGYGPEQMLAEIERGVVQRVVDTPPRYAFYTAIPNHVWRVAGRVAWGGNAPRYVLDADGTVHQAGNLGDREPLALRLGLGRRVDAQLKKSAAWQTLSMGDYRITDEDLRLYFAVVLRSQELLKAQYPGIQFRVILWPSMSGGQQPVTYDKLRDGFRRMGIQVDLAEDILPGYSTDRSPFILSSADKHPNARADRMIAQYVLNQISQ
jgi:hypothetical protein